MADTKIEAIVQSLRDRINSGSLPYGAAVPSSRAIAVEQGCARGTASEALRRLERAGLIENVAGLGFRVVQSALARPAGRRSAGTTRTEHALPFRILGSPGYQEPPSHIAAALGIGPGVLALRRTRLLHQPGGHPVSLVDAWFPRPIAEACELLHGMSSIPGGTTSHIQARTGRLPSQGEDVTTPGLAGQKQARILELEPGALVLIVLHRAWDSDGVLVVEEGVTGQAFARRVDRYPMNRD